MLAPAGEGRGRSRRSQRPASRVGSRLVSGRLDAVDMSDFAGALGIHSDSPAGTLDGQ
jgi:hypothetical protein